MTTIKKIFKTLLIFIGLIIIIGGGIGLYLFNMPARNVQASKTEFSYPASQVVNEYLTDAKAANQKYLAENGDSKILEVTGTVAKISEDFNHQKVVLLKSVGDKAGVSCTFTKDTNAHTKNVKVGDVVTIKGVIRSGASYDADMDLYENVNIEECDIILNK